MARRCESKQSVIGTGYGQQQRGMGNLGCAFQNSTKVTELSKKDKASEEHVNLTFWREEVGYSIGAD